MDLLVRECYETLKPERFSSCNNKTPGSSSCLECFSGQYFEDNAVSYDCHEKRKLYMARYFPVHQAEISEGLSMVPFDAVESWRGMGVVKILSLGGGPGADVYGALKFLEMAERNLSVEVVRVDIEGKWDDAFDDVMGRLPQLVRCKKVIMDVTNGLSSLGRGNFNLVIASYLTSELSREENLKLASEIDFLLMNYGVLIINDRPEVLVENVIGSMYASIGVKCTRRPLGGWAGYSYPQEIFNTVKPKTYRNSTIFVGAKM